MKDLIQKLAKNSDEVFAKICRVTAVDKDNKTADLQPIDGSAPIFDALLISQHEPGGLYLEPKVGATVSAVFIHNELALVLAPNELKKMLLEINKTKMEVDEQGFLLSANGEDLLSLLLDLIAAIKKLKFTTNAGPTIQMINLLDFTKLEPKFKKLLKAK